MTTSTAYSALVAELKDALTRQRYNRVAVHNYCRITPDVLHDSLRDVAEQGVSPA